MIRLIEQEAETIRAELVVMRSLPQAISYLESAGFSCTSYLDRSITRGQPSFMCNKQFRAKELWVTIALHHLIVFLDADNTDNITAVDVLISRGGLQGL
jgi:hypothetical protein